MKMNSLPGLDAAPIVFEPDSPAQRPIGALLEWAQSENALLTTTLHRAGAILFRGFDIEGPAG